MTAIFLGSVNTCQPYPIEAGPSNEKVKVEKPNNSFRCGIVLERHGIVIVSRRANAEGQRFRHCSFPVSGIGVTNILRITHSRSLNYDTS